MGTALIGSVRSAVHVLSATLSTALRRLRLRARLKAAVGDCTHFPRRSSVGHQHHHVSPTAHAAVAWGDGRRGGRVRCEGRGLPSIRSVAGLELLRFGLPIRLLSVEFLQDDRTEILTDTILKEAHLRLKVSKVTARSNDMVNLVQSRENYGRRTRFCTLDTIHQIQPPLREQESDLPS